MELEEILRFAAQNEASDVFIVAGGAINVKVFGKLYQKSDCLSGDDSAKYVEQLYTMANRSMERVNKTGDDDFGLSLPGVSRFRVSAYKQRGSLAATLRLIREGLPDFRKLCIPEGIMRLATKQKGLVLVTGTTGSGKSTTLACLINAINETREGHIITIEDPIEYMHPQKKSVISQREIENDTETYLTALRACLRQAPDVILVGEMRDYETISVATTAAETGHLVFSTLHTVGAASTIDRIIDVFPASQQNQIRSQISMILQSVISQQLIPTVDGKVVAAFEIMHANSAVRNLIREGKIFQIDNTISLGRSEGMISMDTSILELYTKGIISKENAVRYAVSPEQMKRRVEGTAM
ncbi:MAG: PilT/PilU family type 4a pilus ATPase [Oscillospiraceae bacterium]